MDLDIQLSPHFSLRELIVSSHRTIDNIPTAEGIVSHLTALAVKLLEPVRDHFGPLVVTSGYRCTALNAAIGGIPNSAHTFGCAADLMPLDASVTPQEVVRWIRSSPLAYDQVIDEHTSTSSWVHLGKIRPGFETVPRLEALTFRGGKYTPFA